MRTWLRTLVWILGALAAVVAALFATEPFVPTTMVFGSEDLEARERFEQIVAKHGYSFHYEQNALGETEVAVESITPRSFKRIDCEFFAWDAKRLRERGVIVYDRKDCVL